MPPPLDELAVPLDEPELEPPLEVPFPLPPEDEPLALEPLELVLVPLLVPEPSPCVPPPPHPVTATTIETASNVL